MPMMEPRIYYQDADCTLWHGDARDVLPLLRERAALILTDPPYGIRRGAAFVRRSETVIENWDDVGHNVDVDGWHALLSPAVDAHLVEFMSVGLDCEDRVRARHTAAGWTAWRRYLLVKAAPPPTPRPTFVSGWEAALISYQGKRRWFGGGATVDRWIGLTPNRLNQSSGHPTEKPIEPICTLIRALTLPGELVLDPFAGSGTTLRAAKNLGRRTIGCEIRADYCAVIVRRLAQSVLPLESVA